MPVFISVIKCWIDKFIVILYNLKSYLQDELLASIEKIENGRS